MRPVYLPPDLTAPLPCFASPAFVWVPLASPWDLSRLVWAAQHPTAVSSGSHADGFRHARGALRGNVLTLLLVLLVGW